MPPDREQAIQTVNRVKRGMRTYYSDPEHSFDGSEQDWERAEAERIVDALATLPSQPTDDRPPTHLCLDCGAVGYAGGFHDHGGGNAGDTASIEAVLKALREGGDAIDELAEIRAAPSDDRVRELERKLASISGVAWDLLVGLGPEGDALRAALDAPVREIEQ